MAASESRGSTTRPSKKSTRLQPSPSTRRLETSDNSRDSSVSNMQNRAMRSGTNMDSEVILDEWARMVVDATDFTLVAVGNRNQFAPDLSPGSSVSCLRSSLAFLRVVFAYGLDAVLSTEAIDRLLLQGKEWTIETSRDGRYTTCVPHDLPNRILSNEPDGNLCVAFSSSYGELDFYVDENTSTILETQISARTFIEKVWKQKRGDIYCLIVIGVIGIGVYRSDNGIYIFDPHGHGHIGQACIVRVSEGYFYQYLTSYADPSTAPEWSATFVYFVSMISSTPPKEEIISAVSRLYGTADIVLDLGRVNEEENIKVVLANLDPPYRPQPTTTRIIIGTSTSRSEDIKVAVDSRSDRSPVAAGDVDVRREMGYAEEDAYVLPPEEAPVDAICDITNHESIVNAWTTAFPDIGDDLSVLTRPDLPKTRENVVRLETDTKSSSPPKQSFERHKRRRPVWTPPSSSENLSVDGQGQSSSRKPSRKTKRCLTYTDNPVAPSISLSEQADSGSSTTHNIPGQEEATRPDNVSFNEFISSQARAEHFVHGQSLRDRPPFNPHTVAGEGDESLRDGLWTSEHVPSSILSDINANIDDLEQSIALSMGMTIHLSRSGDYDGLLDICGLDTFTRLFNYVIENGARTTTEIGSVVEAEMASLFKAFTRPAHFSAFIDSTGMAVSRAGESADLIESVLSENSKIGKLALSKLVLVALEVEELTDALHKTLDSIEREASTADADRIYERMATSLVSAFNSNPGKIYSENTSLHAEQSLTDRVASLCRFIRDRETVARRKAELILAELEALDAGVRLMHASFDAFIMGGSGGTSGSRDDESIAKVSPSVVTQRLTAIERAAVDAVGNALHEYYLKGALYSANALRANVASTSRFKMVVVEQHEKMARLFASLSVLDDVIALVAARSGAQAPPPVTTAPESKLLGDLLENDSNLENPENLAVWKTAMAAVQAGGWISRQEFETLIKEVDAVNNNAARRETALADLDRLHELEARVASYTDLETTADLQKLEEVMKDVVELVKLSNALGGDKFANLLSSDDRAAIARRRLDAETLIAALQYRYEEIRTLYSSIKLMLRPLQRFAGLRALDSTVKTITQSIPGDTGPLETFLALAPPDVIGTLRTDLWLLFSQYRTILSHPSTSTAAELSGLGIPFSLAIRVILGPIGGYPAASVFFGKHADTLSAAVAAARLEPMSVEKTTAAVTALQNAVSDVNRATADTPSTGIMADLPAGQDDAFSFLTVLLSDAEVAAGVAQHGDRLDGLHRAVRAALNSVIASITKVKTSDPKTAAADSDASVIMSARTEIAHALQSARDANTAIAALESHAHVTDPHIQRKIADLAKSVGLVNQRTVELEAAVTTYERNLISAQRSHSEDVWVSSIHSLLSNAELKSEFDAMEMSDLEKRAVVAGYDTIRFRARAEKIVMSHGRAIHDAIETVLKFNPFSTPNRILPPIAFLKNMTWLDAFIAAAPYYTKLFGVSCDALLQLIKIVLAILRHADARGGNLDYYTLLGEIEPDVRAVPTLAKYVDFYRNGHEEFTGFLARHEQMRVEALHAAGRVDIEIREALENLARMYSPEGARRALEYGVSIVIPSANAILTITNDLEKEDITAFNGTAYAEYSAHTLQRDIEAVSSIKLRVTTAIEGAKSRAEVILKSLAEVSYAADRETAEQLANLKNLLRLVAMPPHIAKAIEKAETANDIVTQAAILLSKVEETKELDTQTVEWLKHARSVIDSHELTSRIDESGPMTIYAERIDALADLASRLDELKSELALAEVAWDDTWSTFMHDKDRMDKSSEGFAAARDSAARAKVSSNTINALRDNAEYARLPAKIIGLIDAKYRDRAGVMDAFLAALKETESIQKQMDTLCAKIPPTFVLNDLSTIASQFDILSKRLPKWYVRHVTRYSRLVKLRLALYAAYSAILPGVAGCPSLLPSDTGLNADANNRPAAGFVDRYLKHRVAAWIRPSVVVTLQEAFSEIDIPGIHTYLDASDAPLRYSVCYRTVGEKMAACLCEPSGLSLRPAIPSKVMSTRDMVVAAGMLGDIMALRLGFVQAAADNFRAFTKYVRTQNYDWLADGTVKAIGSIYCALMAITLTRKTGASLSDIFFLPGQVAPAADKKGLKKIAANGRPVRLELADVMVAIMTCMPGHVLTFSQLDLISQYDFMDKTLYGAINESLSTTAFINCLSTQLSKDAPSDSNCRPMSLTGGAWDPSGGSLFALRYSDWKQGSLSETDPLKPWEGVGGATSTGLAKIRAVVPSNLLTTTTVLARMCIPPTALAVMWSSLLPAEIEQSCRSYDDVVTARGDAASTLDVTTSSVLRPADKTIPKGSDGPNLYEPTGVAMTFTVTSTPPSGVLKVNAMDLAAAATLFGARIVIAAECPEAYSSGSGLNLCVRLFDSRSGSEGCFLEPAAVSSDTTSWGGKLLADDSNPIENACLGQQLEHLSHLIASKPLSSAPPCLVIVDTGMVPVKVLWPKTVFDPIPVIRLTSSDDAVLSELPYIDAGIRVETGASYDDIAVLDRQDAANFFSDESRQYPIPVYNKSRDGDVEDVLSIGTASEDEELPGNDFSRDRESMWDGMAAEKDVYDNAETGFLFHKELNDRSDRVVPENVECPSTVSTDASDGASSKLAFHYKLAPPNNETLSPSLLSPATQKLVVTKKTHNEQSTYAAVGIEERQKGRPVKHIDVSERSHDMPKPVYRGRLKFTDTAAACNAPGCALDQKSPAVVISDNSVRDDRKKHGTPNIPHRSDSDSTSTPFVVASSTKSLIPDDEDGGIGIRALKPSRAGTRIDSIGRISDKGAAVVRPNNASRPRCDTLGGLASVRRDSSPLLQRASPAVITADLNLEPVDRSVDISTAPGGKKQAAVGSPAHDGLYDHFAFAPPDVILADLRRRVVRFWETFCRDPRTSSSQSKPINTCRRSPCKATTAKHDHHNMYRGFVVTEAEAGQNKQQDSNIDPERYLFALESLSSVDSNTDGESQSSVPDSDRSSTDESSASRVISADRLLTRRDFRQVGRSALYALTRACEKMARQIAHARQQLRARIDTLTIEIFKIKMLLTG
ncbi:UL36 protein [Gallid alphaherpesvirus 3]|uniref:UL36 product homolog n=2 Tax=Gallid alphaherpesvirus 3 TaxID=35250 RepID=Q9WSX7_9ALPH|nr:large tegument protein [Gallid alphaherpesvirus 3]BAA78725.1 UL36 protein [Marek's disease virus serotype 2 MDV2]BAA82932.1 UL36 product homolog [Marek's disease virus serotype 2 MDV2]BAB16546.1 UL36 protein [Gallid alphaherpesvirus 3]